MKIMHRLNSNMSRCQQIHEKAMTENTTPHPNNMRRDAVDNKMVGDDDR